MFNGIIQGIGIIEKIFSENKKLISIKTNLNLNDCKIGSSILCDGICLTIISIKKNKKKYLFQINVSEETLKRSTIKYWKNNSLINIEKSLKVGDELSGHFVYGHIDCIGKIYKINKLKSSWNYYFLLNKNFFKYSNKLIVEKGSISINGVSLTVSNLNKNIFCISIIPHTFNNTILKYKKVNDLINIEIDIISKYVSKMVKEMDVK